MAGTGKCRGDRRPGEKDVLGVRETGRRLNRKVRDIAGEVVLTGELPT